MEWAAVSHHVIKCWEAMLQVDLYIPWYFDKILFSAGYLMLSLVVVECGVGKGVSDKNRDYAAS